MKGLEELAAAADEQTLAERGQSLDITVEELLFHVPFASIINAAFCYPGEARFNGRRRGAWYAGVEMETAMAEVAYHKVRFVKDARLTECSFDYQDFLADLVGEYEHLDAAESKACLQREPVPECYIAGQEFAARLLREGANGIVYQSVRNRGGTCVACFRPALVYAPQRGRRWLLEVKIGDMPAFDWTAVKSKGQ
jgi:hypothetical protein